MFKEEDIRPREIQEKFLQLAKEDSLKFFKNCKLEEVYCYVCNKKLVPSFSKDNFTYSSCNFCDSLFVNPRPKFDYFIDYYKNAESSKYWASSLFEVTKQNRTKYIWEPRVQLIKQIIFENSLSFSSVVDIGAGYGLFLNSFSEVLQIDRIAIEPASHLANIIRSSGHTVVEKFIEDVDRSDLPSGSKLFVSFEMFEHLHDPCIFLKKINSLMENGDHFLFTTLSSSGLDIRLLWESSEALSPPHHLNFFNPKSISQLLMNFGFKIKFVNTPGVLDVDILRKNINKIKNIEWKNFIASLNEDSLRIFQNLLIQTGLSSHMMVLIEKPN